MGILHREKWKGVSGANLVAPCEANASWHQIAVEANTATTGTLALNGVLWGNSFATPVLDDDGAPVVIDLANIDGLKVWGSYTSFVFVPTGVDGTYTAAIVDFDR